MLRSTLTKTFAAACTAGLLALGATACSSSGGQEATGTLEKLQNAEKITVATAESPPYSGLTPAGEATGYFPEVATTIFGELGIGELDAKVTDYAGMIPGLTAKQWDAVVAPLNVTTERCEVVLFSGPLTVETESLTVQTGNPEGITGLDSIAGNGDLVLAVLSGSNQEKYALENGIAQGQLLALADQTAMTDAVLSGRADAFMLGLFSAEDIVANQQGFEAFALEGLPLSVTAVAFRPDDAELRDAFDEQLQGLLESGELARMYADWGFSGDPELLGTTALSDVAEGCK